MRFWIGQVFLLLSCVVLPFVAAIYVDTGSEIRRAQQAGGVAVRLAAQNLESRLKLEAHDAVSLALTTAQKIADRDLVGEISKPKERRDPAIAQLEALLAESTVPNGFAWFVDETGTIVAEHPKRADAGEPRRISGHPLYRETQEGVALDGVWAENGNVALVGAAPISVKDQASGAVIVGVSVDRAFVAKLGREISSQVTLVSAGRSVTSTFEDVIAEPIVQIVGVSSEPVSAGSLTKQIEHSSLPLLPLFIAHDAKGLAFSSLTTRHPGLDGLSWMVSAPSGELLREIPERQEIMLAGMLCVAMLALLIGLVNHRVFITPIARITDHLSELQFGRGEMELAESRVSSPFRRMVKLINMTVQKIPSRGFSSARLPGENSPISELPPTSQSRPSSEIRRDEGFLNATVPAPQYSAPQSHSSSHHPATQPPMSKPLLSEHPFEGEDDPLADVVSSLSLSGARRESVPTPQDKRTPDDAAAIAAAIASLEAPMPSQTPARPRGQSAVRSLEAPRVPPSQTGSMKVIKSAADIRGRPSDALMPSPFPPSASEMFRSGDNAHMAPSDELTPVDQIAVQKQTPRSVPRGGGSLDLNAYAALGASAGMHDHGLSPVGESQVDEGGFNPEATVVAPVTDELLRKSASRDETTSQYRVPNLGAGDMTMVQSVPPNLIAQTLSTASDPDDDQGLDSADHAHFKETYERFLEMRKRCGEPTSDLAFDRFLAKLAKNREGLIKKYNCRTVRFQVYEKDGKAALKATPVRAR
jgi:hypothetical protein